jgi:hypothetical protein
MKNLRTRLSSWTKASLFLLVLVLSLQATGGSARPMQQSGGGGLQVSNALINLVAAPGDVYKHQMVVGSGPDAPPLNITIEARGFGQSPDGAFLPLEASEDTSPYSGRTFITNIDNSKFTLEPGGAMPVEVTISVPAELGNDTRYAMVYIYSEPVSAGSNVAQILAVSVPTVITPKEAVLDVAGEISELKVDAITPGKPISILTTVRNTGNRHYKVQGQATISDANGALIADLPIPLTGTSIIPTFSQQLAASYSALDRPEGLAPGTYKVLVAVNREDGSPVGTAETTFVIEAPMEVCPGADRENVQVVTFTNQEPGTVDVRDSLGVQVTFLETGAVTGQVAICKYTEEPQRSPAFAAMPGDGGTGGTALKYYLLRVDGFEQGTARMVIAYKPNELGNVDENSLFLATDQSGNWTKLENLSVQTGAQLVLGDIPVNQLALGPWIFLGGGPSESDAGINWPLYLGVGLALLLIVLLVIWLLSRRSKGKQK